ncbi:MAG TPA: PEGA domain-containing protein [Polyangiaceae bacterium]
MHLMPLQRLLPRIAAGLLAGSVALAAYHSEAIAQEKPAAVKAPDKKTRNAARQAFADGEKAFKADDYAAAHENFSNAHELIPTPHTAYWMAKSLDQMGKVPEAIGAYEAFLADPESDKAGEDKVTDARARLDHLKATLTGTVALVTEPAGASVSVDGEPKDGQTPIELELSPGVHKVRVSMEGFDPQELEIDVKGGERMDQSVTLLVSAPEPVVAPPPPPVTPPPPPPEPRKERSMVPAYVTLGVAGAGAIVGTIFGIQALSAKSDFNDNPTNDAADDVERNALIADMAFGVAITLGVTGIVLLTSDDSASDTARAKVTKREQAKLNVAPYVTPTGGGAAARVIF